MTSDEVRQLLEAAPFVPFTLYLPSNKGYRIDHPDFALLSRGGRIMVVSLEGDAFAHIDLMLATHLETHPPTSQGAEH